MQRVERTWTDTSVEGPGGTRLAGECDYHIVMSSADFDDAFRAWKVADEESRAADKLVAAAWELHLKDGGPMPTEMHEELGRLRARSSVLLAAVIAAMGRTASR